jgi:hypothetical protein
MGSKEYLVMLHRDQGIPRVALDHPILQLGLDRCLLDIVNSYFGLWARLNYVDLWYTIPLGADQPVKASQRWHRDPEDDKILKVFLYFSDVNEEAGPLEYIVGSRRSGGPYSRLWRYGSYPPQQELDARTQDAERVVCTGAPGTFVFCDTSGFHRGGHARSRARVFSVLSYLSPASLSPRLFTLDGSERVDQYSGAAQFALL